MTERLSVGIILSCVAVVIGIVIDLGRMDIAFILIVILVLAGLPSKWFRDWLWKD
ncbi:hypothetical protein P4555_11545 [Peribacillus frigoritolerans]|uniref:hypothetical protein n=1 Tax=Peribacillus frigoritolerans TaxID=450367 RepID=UPI002E1EE3E1|nr:hypothetical protein [Peribacillus frigoritolerans]